MTIFTPKHMRRWREQINYSGDNFDAYFICTWRFFRCSPAERANFKYIRRQCALHDLPEGAVIFPKFTDSIRIYRFYVLAHQDFLKSLRLCDLWAGRIAQRRCLDRDAERVEDDTTTERTWRQSEIPQRIEMCVEAGISPLDCHEDAVPPEVSAVLSEVPL